MPKKRVAIVTTYNAVRPAGLERFLIEWVRALAMYPNPDIKIVLYTKKGSGLRETLAKENINLPVVEIGFGKAWKDIGLFFAPKADHYLFNGQQVPVLFSPKNSSVLVYDFAYKYFALPSWRSRLFDYVTQKGFQRAQRIFTISEATKKDIYRWFPKVQTQASVIYPGCFAIDHITPEPIPDLPEQYFFFIGTLKQRKNVAGLVDAYIQFCKDHPDRLEQLVIAGKHNPAHPYMAAVHKKIAEAGLEENITFVGHVTDAQVAYAYRNAVAIVFPSLLEGFGFPVLEGMSCGRPVITSQTSSLGEVAADAALCIDPENPQEIADKMFELATSPSLQKELIEKGKRRIQDFSWEHMAREYYEGLGRMQ